MPQSHDLFAQTLDKVSLDEGAALLGGYALAADRELLDALDDLTREAPLRRMVTPGGRPMSVTTSSCGEVGWVSDCRGYRYDPIDPANGRRWPAMPPVFAALATRAALTAGFFGFAPDTCLINCYEPGARLSLHQDKNECAFSQPIVSVSLGLSAIFLWGGRTRSHRPRHIPLAHGDVVVWGGPARMAFHGVLPMAAGHHPLTGDVRYNLTFRRAR